jgi:hypothetical protein
MREPEPLRSWGAVAIPIKPRVIGENLDTGRMMKYMKNMFK